MAARITVKASFRPLAGMKLTNQALMREVGLLARERVLRRTIGGRDEDEQAFVAYSPGYAKQKAAELGSSRVNLQVSGAMLNAIVIDELTDRTVTLAFNG